MEIEFEDVVRPWMEAAQLSEDRVAEAIRSATSSTQTDYGNIATYACYKWYADDLIVIASGFAASADFSSSDGRVGVRKLTIDTVFRVSMSAVPALFRGMSPNAMIAMIAKKLGQAVPEVEGNVVADSPEELVLEQFNDLGGSRQYRLHLSDYRRMLRRESSSVLRCPPIAALLASNGDGTPRVLRDMVREFREVLDVSGNDEETLHQWLAKKEHCVFLDANATEVLSKVPFGDRTSDFVIKRADGTYRLVEIERASLRLLKKDCHLRAEFTHAIDQIREWRRYIRDRVETVREELGLTDIDQPEGMVIMGRDTEWSHFQGKKRKAARRKWRSLKGEDPVPHTYDEICVMVDTLADNIEFALSALSQG